MKNMIFGMAAMLLLGCSPATVGSGSGAGGSGGGGTCDDGDPCTVDSATSAGCAHEKQHDGEPCKNAHGAGHCDAFGACVNCTDADSCIDYASSACITGTSIFACGSGGAFCASCVPGARCGADGCEAAPAGNCYAALMAAGTLDDSCRGDTECSADAWCQRACVDVASGDVVAVGKCRPKLSVGAMCAFGTPAPGYPDIGGDHACVTGKCDPTKHTCN